MCSSDLFSDPWNLRILTPPWLAFEIDPQTPHQIHPGIVLRYRVRPAPLLRVRWVTEITHCLPGELFVDEQRFGPYRFWHHQHLFRDVDGGIEMDDVVHYSVGFGPLGTLLERTWVAGKLEEIFNYRADALRRLFPGGGSLLQ